MKLKQSIRYQLEDYKVTLLVYYGVIVVLHFLLLASWIWGAGGSYVSGGLSAISGFVMFICALCSFHDNLPMHLQNGVSRKTMFQARLVVTLLLAAFMAVVDTLLATGIGLLNTPVWKGSANLFLATYFWYDPVLGGLLGVPFSFCLLAFVQTLGYFIIVFFYRLPLRLRIVVGVALGVLVAPGQILVKATDQLLLHNFLARFAEIYVYPAMDFIERTPLLLMACWLGAAAVLSAVTWLILRRTEVRR